MAVQVKGAEEFFLKIVKVVILVMMALSLVAIPVLLVYGVANFTVQMKEPEPAKKAPEKDVTADGIQSFLLDLQKKQDEADNFDPSKKKATEQDQPPGLYLTNAIDVFGCLQKFAVAAELKLPINFDANAEALRFRGDLEAMASKPGRGEPYVKSLNAFVCKVLGDPAIVAMKKESKFKGSINSALTRYHNTSWDRIVNERNAYNASEEARVQQELAAEGLRVATTRARAMAALTAAGVAFGAFMLLALYLLMTKIETNMRDINESIRTRAG